MVLGDEERLETALRLPGGERRHPHPTGSVDRAARLPPGRVGRAGGRGRRARHGARARRPPGRRPTRPDQPQRGLGLTIVRGVVDAHGGELQFGVGRPAACGSRSGSRWRPAAWSPPSPHPAPWAREAREAGCRCRDQALSIGSIEAATCCDASLGRFDAPKTAYDRQHPRAGGGDRRGSDRLARQRGGPGRAHPADRHLALAQPGARARPGRFRSPPGCAVRRPSTRRWCTRRPRT